VEEKFPGGNIMSIFNVLNPGPNAAAPYQQPNTQNPTANPAVASYAVGNDVLQMNLTGPTGPPPDEASGNFNAPNRGVPVCPGVQHPLISYSSQ
jgi:hypothetical protein